MYAGSNPVEGSILETLMLDWSYIVTGVYALIALFHFVYFISLAIGSIPVRGTGYSMFMIVALSLFWPIAWIWYFIDYFRGRVA